MDIQKEIELFEEILLANPDFDEALLSKDENYDYEDSSIADQLGFFQAGIEVAEREAHMGAKAQAVPEWISVKDKLPEIGVYVMVFLEKQGHNPTTYNFCQYTKFGFHLSNVTHWMHLPGVPKAQEQKG